MQFANRFQIFASICSCLIFAHVNSAQTNVTFLMDKDSNAVLVCQSLVGTNPVIQGAYMSGSDNVWTNRLTLSDPALLSYSPDFALNSQGYGVAVWISYASEGCCLCAAIFSEKNWLSTKVLTQIGEGKPFDYSTGISEQGKILVSWSHNVKSQKDDGSFVQETLNKTATANAYEGNSSWLITTQK